MGRVTPDVTQSVRDVIDIVDLAGEMTRLARKGRKYEGLCPFHKEKTPSFGVDPDKGLFYCFGCGAGGDAIKLYQQYHGDDFVGTIEALAQRYGIPLAEGSAGRADFQEQRDRTAALEAAAQFFRHQLEGSDFARGYLEKRQISASLIERFGLGYAPEGWDHLLEALSSRFSTDLLAATGLLGKSDKTGRHYDRFRHRLMFPIHSATGRVVGFGGRTLGDDKAKYVNTAETEQFHKGRLLYGLDLAKRSLRDGGKALLVEGYFDVIGAAACGVDWAVAGMGTALTAEQATLLARYTDTAVLAYDGDAAGEKAFRRALPILLAAGLGVRRALFPAGHDPDSLRIESGEGSVNELIEGARDAVELEIERLSPQEVVRDANARARAATAIAEILQPVRDKIARYGYAQHAAERLDVPLDLLMRRVGRASGPRSRPAPPARSGPPPGLHGPGEPPWGGGPVGDPEMGDMPQGPWLGDDSSPESLPVEPGMGTPSPGGGSQAEVHTLEERVLVLLLNWESEIPLPDDLPPDDVFFDRQCRNIYATFCDLHTGGEFDSPKDVVAKLGRDDGTLDRVARLLVQLGDSGGGEAHGDSLRTNLDRLLHRWNKHRQAELMRQIRQAQQHDDQARLVQLLEEKKDLSRSLHPSMKGKLW